MGEITKGCIGREDFNVQENDDATETFNRTASEGGVVAIEKMPDIWDGEGHVNIKKLTLDSKVVSPFVITLLDDAAAANILTTLGLTATVAEINTACDGITATAAELNQLDGVGAIIGDATAARTIRTIRITIDDATTAAELKCTVASQWNGDTIAVTDDIGKGETVGNFTLNAAGGQLVIEAAGLTGNCVAVISAVLDKNDSTEDITVYGRVGANDIILDFYDLTAGDAEDLTGLVDTGPVYVSICYITDA